MAPLTALWLASCFVSACAEEVPVTVQQDDDDDGARAGSGGTGGNFLIDEDDTPPLAGTGGTGTIDGKDRECGPPPNNASCAGQIFAGKSIPLDIFIMFDQSGSMCACLDQGAGQLCLESHLADDLVTTCEWLPEYACLRDARCGPFGPGGACGWEETPELLECLERAGSAR